MKNTQAQRLLAYLQAGNVVDNLSGWTNLGIYAVSQRIGDLIKQGYPVQKAWRTIYNGYGEKVRVKAYWLPHDRSFNALEAQARYTLAQRHQRQLLDNMALSEKNKGEK